MELLPRAHSAEVNMKSTLLSVFFVALMVVGVACASNSGGSTGTGGASGSGGTSSAGGSRSSGGSDTGGAAGSGGAQASGGAQGSGGAQDSGGAPGEDGKQGTGGARSSGGASAGDAGRDVPAKNDAAAGDTAVAKDARGLETQGGEGIRERQIKTRGFTFDALEAGPDGGEPVLLLHGFPEISLEWSALMPVLAANGYHCLAPDQRGYSPGARPTEVDAYKYEELVADAFAIGSELGEKFHLVAHDWGANIAWLMLQKDPSRIASYTALAVPHYQVWARAVYEDPDMAGYLSMLNTWMTVDKGEAFWTPTQMRNMWKGKKPDDLIEATIAHMTEPGAMTAALSWYRASDGHKSVIQDFEAWKVDVPTLLIFGSTDMGQGTVADTKPLMTGPYRVVQPKGGHFIVDEQPKVVADETLAHLQAYPIE
jgi:pimeloyl-ACP methyl ester carboxylesterase